MVCKEMDLRIITGAYAPDPIAILRLIVMNVFEIKLEKIKNKFWDGKIFKKKLKLKSLPKE